MGFIYLMDRGRDLKVSSGYEGGFVSLTLFAAPS